MGAAAAGSFHEVKVVEQDIVAATLVTAQGPVTERGWGGQGSRFARYITATWLSLYGDWFSTVALVVLLYRLSGPAAPAGYMLARVLPRLLSANIGGNLADRLKPQHVVAGCAAIQALFTLSIVLSARIQATWAIYGAVAIAQFAGGVSRPASASLIPRVAPPGKLQRANALYTLGFSSSVAVAPAIAGPLLPAIGAEALLIIDTLTFAVASFLMLTLRVRGAGAWAPPAEGAVSGLRAVWRDPVLRVIAAAWACSAIAATAGGAVLVLVAGSLGDASAVGYLYAAMGGCAVLVGFVMLLRRTAFVGRDVIVGFAVLEVVGLALLTLHGGYATTYLALAVTGGSAVVWQTLALTDVHLRADPARMGRVNAVIVQSMTAGMLVGALLALALVPWAGWEHALFIACCVSLLVLAAGVVLGPQRRSTPD